MWPANSATANRMMFLRFMATRSVAARGHEFVPRDPRVRIVRVNDRARGARGELPALAAGRYLFRHHDIGESRGTPAAGVDEHEVLHGLWAAAGATALAPTQLGVSRARR